MAELDFTETHRALARAEDTLPAMRKAVEQMRRLSVAFKLGRELDLLRRRAEHFATPGWQRPFWRLRVRLKLRAIARNARPV